MQFAEIQQAMRKLHAPATIRGGLQGTAKAFEESLANERVLLLAASATIYIVLGILYESFIHPFTILSTLPSAGCRSGARACCCFTLSSASLP